MGAQHGKLDVEGRVEHHVGSLLIGEYPLVFGLTHILPLRDGLLGGKGAFVVVADDAAQQTVVANGNPVVVIQRDTGQRRGVDLVFHGIRNILRQQRVQSMDTFYDKYGVASQLQLLAVGPPATNTPPFRCCRSHSRRWVALACPRGSRNNRR